MQLSHITVQGFKSFAKKTTLDVTHQVTGVVGPNGSGKSNIAESIRFVLGEQSMKTMRGKIGADIIWKGSEHLAPSSRASVTMVIDNRVKVESAHISPDLAPYLAYDELTLARTIYADGTSDYTLNDAKVRLKDVQELLSFAGIGGSAHTIINQGEADRILLANPRDRKEALEDALGLRVYHMRLTESKRKLEKVKSHVHEVSLIKKEIQPHLTHLKRQVEKIEKEEEERKNLHRLLVAYLNREEKEVEQGLQKIQEAGTSESLAQILSSITKEIELLEQGTPDSKDVDNLEKETLEVEIRSFYERKDSATKSLGRLEAEKNFLLRDLERVLEKKDIVISQDDFTNAHATSSHYIEQIDNAITSGDIAKAKHATESASTYTEEFFTKYTQGTDVNKKKEILDQSIISLDESIRAYEDTLSLLQSEVDIHTSRLDKLQQDKRDKILSRHEEEKKLLELRSKSREFAMTITLRKNEEASMENRKQKINELLREGVMLVGRDLIRYRELDIDEKYLTIPLYDLTRAIERSKIRIEEATIPNRTEVLEEYKSTRERDEYLTKELADIEASEEKLQDLITELTDTLATKFAKGVDEVSKVFNSFFQEVFGGGSASLTKVTFTKIDDEGNEHHEDGVDIDVSLPNKKVREIGMFSGGERALVSIALLFAMSSITPPPFMVLDETDAPLDESNARKYGMMLKRLAEKSKLLVITHNRETMNHCDMLYGVTLGVDGGSKLLSINLKQAEDYAK